MKRTAEDPKIFNRSWECQNNTVCVIDLISWQNSCMCPVLAGHAFHSTGKSLILERWVDRKPKWSEDKTCLQESQSNYVEKNCFNWI